MTGLPDRALMRAVADVVITEEKARAAADRVVFMDERLINGVRSTFPELGAGWRVSRLVTATAG